MAAGERKSWPEKFDSGFFLNRAPCLAGTLDGGVVKIPEKTQARRSPKLGASLEKGRIKPVASNTQRISTLAKKAFRKKLEKLGKNGQGRKRGKKKSFNRAHAPGGG